MADLPARMLVINEWLFHDITGENGQPAQRETARFLRQFEQSDDKFAVLWGSKWIDKSHDLMTHTDLLIESLSILVQNLIWASDKCLMLHPDDVENAAPQDAIDAAPDEDIYLIQTYYAADADLLITTDEGLHDAFASRQDVDIVFRKRIPK